MIDHSNEAGEWHRVNGPAMDWEDGDGSWYYNGQRHRYYGPARHYYHEEEYYIFGDNII